MLSRLTCIAAGLALAACNGSGSGSMMTGPTSAASQMVMVSSVSPRGGATGVSVNAPIEVSFESSGAARAADQLQGFMVLHQGGLGGPSMPMTCTLQRESRSMTCVPDAVLQPRTTYTLHLGGGMMAVAPRPSNMTMPMMGGVWVTPSMMGGAAVSHMNPGWMGSNGTFGMAFSFVTR